MSSPRRAFIDANVFVSTWTADALLTLAEQKLFEPRWSEVVFAEVSATLERMGLSDEQIQHYLDTANAAFPLASVKIDEAQLDAINLPDPDDRHVVLGALASNCDAIVTYNLKDFPSEALTGTGIEAMHPDDFLLSLAQANPALTVSAIHELAASKKRPPRSMEAEIAGLRKNRLVGFAGFLTAHETGGEQGR